MVDDGAVDVLAVELGAVVVAGVRSIEVGAFDEVGAVYVGAVDEVRAIEVGAVVVLEVR